MRILVKKSLNTSCWRHLIAFVHLEGLEVLQFSQIPELHAIVISRRGKVVTLQTKGLNQIKAFFFLIVLTVL